MTLLDTGRTANLKPEAIEPVLVDVRAYLKPKMKLDLLTDVPGLVSRVPRDDPARLRRYGAEMWVRVIHWSAFTLFKTYHMAGVYLSGMADKNPLALVMAARGQMEFYAAAAWVRRTIEDNAGTHDENLADRVQTVDEALINSTYGFRSSFGKGLAKSGALAGGIPIVGRDLKSVLFATNVMDRLEQLEASGEYPGCVDEYAHLCEFVHPNIGHAMLFLQAPADGQRFWKLAATSDFTMNAARAISYKAMARSCDCTIQTVNLLEDPFPAAG